MEAKMPRKFQHAFIAGASCLALALFGTSLRAQTTPAWGPLNNLVGEWVAGAGSGGKPGDAIRAGESWQTELDGKILVRHDFSEYAAADGRPAFRHEGM